MISCIGVCFWIYLSTARLFRNGEARPRYMPLMSLIITFQLNCRSLRRVVQFNPGLFEIEKKVLVPGLQFTDLRIQQLLAEILRNVQSVFESRRFTKGRSFRKPRREYLKKRIEISHGGSRKMADPWTGANAKFLTRNRKSSAIEEAFPKEVQPKKKPKEIFRVINFPFRPNFTAQICVIEFRESSFPSGSGGESGRENVALMSSKAAAHPLPPRGRDRL